MSMKKVLFLSLMMSCATASAENMNDLINQAMQEQNKAKPVAQTLDMAPQSRKNDVPPPRLVAVRGVNDRVTATFESETGAFEASTMNPELGGGWSLVSISGTRAQIRRGNEKPVTVFLTNRVGNSSSSKDYLPPPPSIAQF